MTQIAFVDIDDTLMQTLGKCPEGSTVVPAGFGSDGTTLSYMTQEQRYFFDFLSKGVVIPVTGRNNDALKRTTLSFSGYKVVSHGAVVLDDNDQPLASWLNEIEHEIPEWSSYMSAINNQINERIQSQGLKMRSKIIIDYMIPAYISIKAETKDDIKDIAALSDIFNDFECRPGSRVHENGRNIALMPAYTKKELAVQHLMGLFKGQFDNPVFVGAGDSYTDIPFMDLCHYQIKPKTSQIKYNV